MLKKILIIGGAGNMGRRYATICRFLGATVEIFDIGTKEPLECMVKRNDGVIITSPTKEHRSHIFACDFHRPNVAILCEKPVVTDTEDLDQFDGIRMTMVNQYAFIAKTGGKLRANDYTLYDYYHSGGDGLYWDCINIIGLDETGHLILRKESPIWKCVINGREIDRNQIDLSYVLMVQDWMKNPEPNLAYMKKAHKKVLRLVSSKYLSGSKQDPIVQGSQVKLT
jgi:hypothetical protein